MVTSIQKILRCYPFKNLGIRLVEGFSAYDGAIGDKTGERHEGIDYVLKLARRFLPFEVFAMHGGEAFRGVSETWGSFVVVRRVISPELRYDTIYAHIDEVPESIPLLPRKNQKGSIPKGLVVEAGDKLGVAGTSGMSHGIPQLHFELHEKVMRKEGRKKIDPYGVEDRASSGRYPQPGESLKGLLHAWISDTPQFVS